MTITRLLTTSAKKFLHGSASTATLSGGEHTRQAPTGDPRLDLAHADRDYR